MPKKTKFISVYKVHLEDSDSNHQQSLLLSPGPIIVYSLLIYPCQSLTHSLSNSLVEIGLKFGRAFSKVLHGFVRSVAWTRPSKQCEFCNYIFDCQDCQSSPGGTSGPGEPGGPGADLKFVKKFTRPNFRAKKFYTLKTHKARLFLPAINSENASLSVIWPSFG